MHVDASDESLHFDRSVDGSSRHRRRRFADHCDVIRRERRGNYFQRIERRFGRILVDGHRLSVRRKVFSGIVGDGIDRFLVFGHPDRPDIAVRSRFRRKIRYQLGKFQIAVVMVEYVHGQTGKFVFAGEGEIAVSVAGKKGQCQAGVHSRRIVPGGLAARQHLHGDGEQQNDSGYLILLHGFLFLYRIDVLFLPGSDFYRSIVKPEAYGYFRLVLVFDGDSVLVHKIRQFDGFIANLAAAVRQF